MPATHTLFPTPIPQSPPPQPPSSLPTNPITTTLTLPPVYRSPFVDLGPDLFTVLLSHICNQSLETPLTTAAYRTLLPFAVCSLHHYILTTNAIRGLSLLPLHFTPNPTTTPTYTTLSNTSRPPPFPFALLPFKQSPQAPIPPPHPLPSLCTPPTPPHLNAHLPSALSNLPALRTLLFFRNSEITDVTLFKITQHTPNLSELRLRACRTLTTACLPPLHTLRKLKILDLSYARNFTDEAATPLATHPTLTTLLIAAWPITDVFLSILAESRTIVDVCLTACVNITSSACRYLAAMRNVKALRLRSIHTLHDEAFKWLATCPTLQFLDVSLARSLTNEALKHLTLPPNPTPIHTRLHTLHLSNLPHLTDAGTNPLTTQTTLQILDLSHCHQLTDLTITNLRHLPYLHTLTLSGCPNITDVGIHTLARTLPSLHTLALSRCIALTDNSTHSLSNALNVPLRLVDIRRCYAITPHGISVLQSACHTVLRSAPDDEDSTS